MRLPHRFDYIYSDDDLILDANVKIARVEEVIVNNSFEKHIKVRFIHHFGYKLFLGEPVIIKGYFYDMPYGETGIQSILTGNMQILIPRKETNMESTKIILAKNKMFNSNRYESFKEIVLSRDNKPKTITYSLGRYNEKEKFERKYFSIKRKEYDIIVSG